MNVAENVGRRATAIGRLPSPIEVRGRISASVHAKAVVARSRRRVVDILGGRDDRLLVVVGPCSAHDPVACVAYAGRLAALAAEVDESLLLVMRVYVEKPRTRLGWTGLVGDPLLDGTHNVEEGILRSRRLMCAVSDLGLPVGCEFLSPVLASYLSDLVVWGSIGARTVLSQPHRQMASGLGMPIGIKNPTCGRVEDAIDAIITAARGHVAPGIDSEGHAALLLTSGNPDCHVVLRGGTSGPNCSAIDVARTVHLLRSAGLPPRVVVDASHDNSGRNPTRQYHLAVEVAHRIAGGEFGIAGVMLESFLVAGRQDLDPGRPERLVFGQSITDACAGWDETVEIIGHLARAVAARGNSAMSADAR